MNKLIYILVFCFSGLLIGNSKFSSERLEEASRNFVNQIHGEAKTQILGVLPDYSFEEDGIVASMDFDGNNYGNTFLKLIFKKDKKIIKSVRFPLKIEIYLNVPVLKNDLRTGDILSESDIKIEKRLIAKKLSVNPNNLIGMELKRSMNSGDIIYPEFLEAQPVIEMGTDVTLMVISGKVSVKASGEALNDAAPGDKVRVKKKNSQIVVEGIASNEGYVIIQ